MKPKHVLVLAVALYGLFAVVEDVSAQGTAFTYQGRLNSSGSPANGNYDFTFSLFNNSGTNSGQIGSTLTNLDVDVTNGLFTVALDFGGVFTGNATWLAIGVGQQRRQQLHGAQSIAGTDAHAVCDLRAQRRLRGQRRFRIWPPTSPGPSRSRNCRPA